VIKQTNKHSNELINQPNKQKNKKRSKRANTPHHSRISETGKTNIISKSGSLKIRTASSPSAITLFAVTLGFN